MSETPSNNERVWPQDIASDIPAEMAQRIVEVQRAFLMQLCPEIFQGGSPTEEIIENRMRILRNKNEKVDAWLKLAESKVQRAQNYQQHAEPHSRDVLQKSPAGRWVIDNLFPSLPSVCLSNEQIRVLIANAPLSLVDQKMLLEMYHHWTHENDQMSLSERSMCLVASVNSVLERQNLLITQTHVEDVHLGKRAKQKVCRTLRLVEVVKCAYLDTEKDPIIPPHYTVHTLHPIDVTPSTCAAYDEQLGMSYVNLTDLSFDCMPVEETSVWTREVHGFWSREYADFDPLELERCRTSIEEIKHSINGSHRLQYAQSIGDTSVGIMSYAEHRLTPGSAIRERWWQTRSNDKMDMARSIEECNAKLTAAAVGPDPRYVLLECKAFLLWQRNIAAARTRITTESAMIVSLLWKYIHGAWPERFDDESLADAASILAAMPPEELRLCILRCYMSEFGEAIDGAPFCSISPAGHLIAERETNIHLVPLPAFTLGTGMRMLWLAFSHLVRETWKSFRG